MLDMAAGTAENSMERSASLGRNVSASTPLYSAAPLEEQFPPAAVHAQQDMPPAPQQPMFPGQEELQPPLHRTPSNPKQSVPPLVPQPAEQRMELRAEPQMGQRAEPRVEPRATSSPRLAAVLGRQRPPSTKGATSISPSRSGNLQQGAGKQQPGRPTQRGAFSPSPRGTTPAGAGQGRARSHSQSLNGGAHRQVASSCNFLGGLRYALSGFVTF